MRESKELEFKESVSNSFLKTVSAYANYGTGKILFGIADDGTVKGLENVNNACLDIESRINNSISPLPEYTLSIDKKKSIVILTVEEGVYKPYLYNSKAYIRKDSSTIAVDRISLSRLILEGQNLSVEELSASRQDLKFSLLESKLMQIIGIKCLNIDIMKTLELYTDKHGFNKAGELLADKNTCCGIDIVRFGENINIIKDRNTLNNMSILDMYDKAVDMYRRYYQYEQIIKSERVNVSTIPEEAFREAIANALVHRTWDIDAPITVSMFPDHIDVVSPGGLPNGVGVEDYLRGGLSLLRNRIIGGVFFRLRLIEKFGTGIRRIKEAYRGGGAQPVFGAGEASIRVVLPTVREPGLSPDEGRVRQLLKGRALSSSQVVEATGFGKSKTVAILNRLLRDGLAVKSGKGRGVRYSAV